MTGDGAEGAASSSGGAGFPTKAAELFAELAAELEEGRGDPAAFFAAHPGEAGELERLYRAWCAADAMFRAAAGAESLVGEVRRGLARDKAAERVEAELARLAVSGFAQRYEVGEVLGRGGMGEVRRVTERVLGRELAMKVLRPVEAERRTRLLLRFLEEAEVIGRLEHPGIVPIHELGLDPRGQVYFTMPLVRGRTLGEILPLAQAGQEGWTRARVLEVVLKACDAVAFAHSRGVLHRDLKPANVMVGQFGEVYVMDWGLARTLGGAREEPGGAPGASAAEEAAALTLAGEVLGTPAYMAPEQAAGQSAALDARCDVYALGAILYEFVTGSRPYGERSSVEALELLEREPPTPVERLARDAGDELCAIVRRAMARAREERYASVSELAHDLRAFLEGRVVRAHRTGAWIEARKWVARNRALAAVGVALAGGLAVALVLLWRVEREAKNVLRLSLGRKLEALVEQAAGLWPAHPSRQAEMERWLGEARVLAAALESDPTTGEPGLRTQLAELAAREASWSEEDRWWHEQLARLVEGIELLVDAQRGYAADGLGPDGLGVARRRALAERVERESAAPEVAERWRAAAAAVRADARFRGLELVPLEGLVPLGADPESGLQEFAHLLSGETPARGADGKLVLGAESALVLVLIPGGETWVGTQDSDPSAPNYNATRHGHERPVTRVMVAPFLLAKHELTQAQWRRAVGDAPSYFKFLADERLPVEQISWTRARLELERIGLRLPGEDEWEHACRAGSTAKFHWGDDTTQFPRYANVRDQSMLPFLRFVNDPIEALDDGDPHLAPVGRRAPNPFGLHDLHGNAFEWCADPLAYPGCDPRMFTDPLQRVFRGGSFQRILEEAHAGRRSGDAPDYSFRSIGVRPARGLEP